ncbi:hypothetical protein FJU11_01565 [Pararhizobium mangrovi]|uniref:Uncharacterized protein n=1 Tax=Pararhizobium mangrovi TaxID=2590452 RepID=A0A506UI72_9HYPH|nr:hypothetical protein FJU11_01565 [Pararhizobium mangrovi]
MPTDRPETLALYRLVPLAAANDPRWDGATSQGEVVVRAYSPADARLVATAAETDFRQTNAKPGDGNSTAIASAFRDDKLYTVVDEPEGRFSAKGERAFVAGSIDENVIMPLTDDE